MTFVITLGIGSVLIWMLIGAPWTSLEWTRGLSLRYALPIAALLPLLACIAIFPLSWRWYEHSTVQPIALSAFALVGSAQFLMALDPRSARYVNVPTVTLAGAVTALGVVAIRWWISSSRWSRWIAAVAVPLFALVWAPAIAGRAAREEGRAMAQETKERVDFARGTFPESPARQAYLLTLSAEDAARRSCGRRRFFALARFDEPLMLQSPSYVNQVFYAGRDLKWTARAAPLGACDYVITTAAVMGTDKGAALVAALAAGAPVDQLGSAGPFVIVGRRP